MLAIVKWPWVIASLPVRLLWRAYMGLWWAFDDSSRSRTQRALAAEAAAGENAAFEIVDSSPRPAPAPIGLLRAGFAASVLVSASAAAGLTLLAAGRFVEPGTAAIGWAWTTAATMVAGVWLVRRRVTRRSSAPRRARDAGESVTRAGHGAAGGSGGAAGIAPPQAGASSPVPPDRSARTLAARWARAGRARAMRGAAFVRSRAPEAARRVRAAWRALVAGEPVGPKEDTPATGRG